MVVYVIEIDEKIFVLLIVFVCALLLATGVYWKYVGYSEGVCNGLGANFVSFDILKQQAICEQDTERENVADLYRYGLITHRYTVQFGFRIG